MRGNKLILVETNVTSMYINDFFYRFFCFNDPYIHVIVIHILFPPLVSLQLCSNYILFFIFSVHFLLYKMCIDCTITNNEHTVD